MIEIIYLFGSCAFFAKLAGESKLPAWAWVLIALGVYFLGSAVFGGLILGGIAAHVILFVVVCVLWIVRPVKRPGMEDRAIPGSRATDQDNPYRAPGRM